MIRPFLYLITAFFFMFSAYADVIYFWIDNDDMQYQNQLHNVDVDTFTCYITWNNGNQKFQTDVQEGTEVLLDLGFWQIKTDVTTVDLGHNDVDVNSVVYKIDTGRYHIDASRGPAYSFLLELDMNDGTHYSAQFAEANVSQHWMTQKHVCSGVTFTYYAAPEPSSFLLMLIGLSTLMLKRKKS